MDYKDTLDFLYNRLQSFHNNGAVAYKPGLEKALTLSAAFGNPHVAFQSIHVGGTNGKGSVSHSLASVLMAAGLKVGLYTSPHLVDFRERIRVDGVPIREEEVVDFVERFKAMNLTGTDPSFFELTTIMAFEHFARHKVDVAVIEVGLGGRLDTTNIITPLLSVITNISYDHTALLGNTLAEIAREKAGIIKPGVPVVIGRRHPETDTVFISKNTDTIFAQDAPVFEKVTENDGLLEYTGTPYGVLHSCLTGDCQPENMSTILTALPLIGKSLGLKLDNTIVDRGLRQIVERTGLMGRWMTVRTIPHVVADTAHNVDGWKYISQRLKRHLPRPLYLVLGFVSDKDYLHILEMLPRDAHYFIVQPSVNRAASSEAVAAAARSCGLTVSVYPTVADGYRAALRQAGDDSDALIYVGGSTFVVADLLTVLKA